MPVERTRLSFSPCRGLRAGTIQRLADGCETPREVGQSRPSAPAAELALGQKSGPGRPGDVAPSVTGLHVGVRSGLGRAWARGLFLGLGREPLNTSWVPGGAGGGTRDRLGSRIGKGGAERPSKTLRGVLGGQADGEWGVEMGSTPGEVLGGTPNSRQAVV